MSGTCTSYRTKVSGEFMPRYLGTCCQPLGLDPFLWTFWWRPLDGSFIILIIQTVPIASQRPSCNTSDSLHGISYHSESPHIFFFPLYNCDHSVFKSFTDCSHCFYRGGRERVKWGSELTVGVRGRMRQTDAILPSPGLTDQHSRMASALLIPTPL